MFSKFTLFAVLVTCLSGCYPDSPYDDPDFRAKHTNLLFCADVDETEEAPRFTMTAFSRREELTFEKQGDGRFCARPKEIVIRSLSQHRVKLWALNDSAHSMRRVEVRYPALNDTGQLTPRSVFLAKEAGEEIFSFSVISPWEDTVLIAPRAIPDELTNDLL